MLSQYDLSAYLVASFFNYRNEMRKKRCCEEVEKPAPRWEME